MLYHKSCIDIDLKIWNVNCIILSIYKQQTNICNVKEEQLL